MKGKVWIICTIFGIVLAGIKILPKEPKVINCITTTDSAYLTILAENAQFRNDKNLEKEIIQICREDRQMNEILYISVYSSRKNLEKGKTYLKIKNETKDSSFASN